MLIENQTTADGLASILREMINTGSLPDGTRLVERELASQFDVSRIPLREALQQLEREGLVRIYKNRGAVVSQLTGDDIEEIYHLRAILEGDVAWQAAQNIDDETLARAELIHHLLGSATTPQKQGALNREFHDILYSCCKNTRQIRLINELCNQIERYENLQRNLLADTHKFQLEHEEILQAFREKDADQARQATISHLTSAKRVVLDWISKK